MNTKLNWFTSVIAVVEICNLVVNWMLWYKLFWETGEPHITQINVFAGKAVEEMGP